MSEKNTGGPAFPMLRNHVDTMRGLNIDSNGLTVRDYFAAKALQGILANYSGHIGTDHPSENMNIALAAYSMADTMLKAREL